MRIMVSSTAERARKWANDNLAAAAVRRRAQSVLLRAGNAISKRDYPKHLAVTGPNHQTLEFLATTNCNRIAELGVYRGDTSIEIAKWMPSHGELHLFDFVDRVEDVTDRLRRLGYTNVVGHPNSHRTFDSYNWSLMEVLRDHEQPCFDYVIIDGAHTWFHDALAFLLVDRLLLPGGYVDFDDYSWSFATSPSLSPTVFPKTARDYTDEQIQTQQVALVVELLARRGSQYTDVVSNKVFQKCL
jgi:predicted O-methyltransferase YrrM